MANDGTIASRLQLDGEQQYKKALNDAYRSLRVLKSELKAETAELGRNATEQEKARAKSASLQKQIAEQQKIVKTLEKALADSRKEYADNQEVQDKWAEKLNKAREALANMQNQMGACQDSLGKFGDGMRQVADSSGEAMQTVISFNDAMKGIGNIASGIGSSLSSIFSATVDTMKSMVDEMFSLMGQAWAAAGDWKDIQSIWGGDLESIEKVFTGMQLQGVDTSLITGGIQKLVNNTHSGNKETKEALKELHVSEKDAASHWEYFVNVMEALEKRKGTDRDKLARAIFGDTKGSGMMLVLDNWLDANSKYEQDYEQTGLALAEQQIEDLDKVSHKITEVETLWNGIKTNIGAKLSEILNMDQLTEDTLELLRTIGGLFNGDEESRAELTVKLSEELEKLIGDISSGMKELSKWLKDLGGELQKSTDPLVAFIGDLISGLGGILDWLGENSGTIIEWLNRLLPVMGANKVSELTTGKGIGDWVTDIINLGLDFAVLGKLFGSSAGTAIGGAAAGFGATAGGAIGGTASTFAGTVVGVIQAAIPNLAAAFVAWQTVKRMPSDTVDTVAAAMGVDAAAKAVGFNTDANKAVTQINKNAGLVTFGDVMEQIKRTTKGQNQRSMNAILDAVWNPASSQTKGVANGVNDLAGKILNSIMFPFTPKGYDVITDEDLTPDVWDVSDQKQQQEQEESTGLQVTQDQISAAQKFWDIFRENPMDFTDEQWDEFEGAFAGQEELFDSLNSKMDELVTSVGDSSWKEIEDLPADWFQSISSSLKNLTKDNYKGTEDENLPGRIGAAVATAVKGAPITVNVYVDGDSVTQSVNRNLGIQMSRLFGP